MNFISGDFFLLTFSRGSRVSIAGRLKSTPFGVDAIGHVPSSWFSSA